MHNILLVCTRHQGLGSCNSVELRKIIERVNPEIIFEELSHNNFDLSYNKNTRVGLETDAIKAYLQDHSIAHIPVDTYKLPNSYHTDLDRMYNTLFNRVQIVECRDLRNLMDYQSSLISKYGFSYLNSTKNEEIFEKIDTLKERILSQINDESLFRISKVEKEVIEKREYEIISNIYKYSKEHAYNQALMFIGSGHRKAIIDKIGKCELENEVKLNWNFYEDQSIHQY